MLTPPPEITVDQLAGARHASYIELTHDMVRMMQHALPEQSDLVRVTDLLGGPRVLKRSPSTQLDAHELLRGGLPQRALDHLVVNVRLLKGGRHFENAVGMSYRTYQRRKDPGREPLSPEQSGKTWTFARVLAKATEIFGSQEAAETWISEPVLGLDRQVPLELLQTPAGIDLVNVFLTRLEYGVYT